MFKDKIRDLRNSKNLTQEELAKKLHISRQSISKWENGLSYPTKESLSSLCEIFDVKVTDLLSEEEMILISIDNKDNIDSKGKRNIVLFSLIGTIIIMLSIFVLVINKRVDELSVPSIEDEPIDTFVGFIVLDEEGINQYENNDNKTEAVYNLLDGIYPFEFIDVLNKEQMFLNRNKIFNRKIKNFAIGIEYIEGTVYFNTTDKFLLSIGTIRLSQDDNYYLTFDNIMVDSNITITNDNIIFGDKSITNRTYQYNLKVQHVDTLTSINLLQYDNEFKLIKKESLIDLNTLTLEEETLYIVIEEIYEGVSGDNYLRKIKIEHYEIDKEYYYITHKFNDVFGDLNYIRINTII